MVDKSRAAKSPTRDWGYEMRISPNSNVVVVVVSFSFRFSVDKRIALSLDIEKDIGLHSAR